MGKLTGIALILCGCGGILVNWYERQKRRQRTAAVFIQLLVSWEYSLEREKMRLSDFLEQYTTGNTRMDAFLETLNRTLKTCSFPTGDVLWREVLEQYREDLDLSDTIWEFMCSASGAFFGSNRKESMQCAEATRRRIEEQLAEERREFVRRQKVYMPVGMLGGVLLVILLI